MFTIIIVILADLIGYSLLVPIYPLIHEYYQVSDLQIGLFVQVWAIFLCFGGLFFGVLSDKTSRRTGLVIPMLGSTLTYLLAFFVDSYSMLLVCRALNGFFNGNFVVAMAAAADISTPQTRLKNMSAVGAALSFSWVVGPMVGGLVASAVDTPYLSIHVPFLLSAVFSLFGFILTLVLFPKIDKQKLIEATPVSEKSVFRDFLDNLLTKKMLFYTALSILFMSTLTGAQVYFSLWLENAFHFTSARIGLAWGVFGVAAFVGQVSINRIFYRIDTHILIVIGFIGMGLSFISWSLTQSAVVVYIAAMVLFFFSSFVMSGINTRVSLSGHPDKMGLIFGINQAFSGIGRVIAPSFLGLLVTYINYAPAWVVLGIIFVVSGAVCTLVFTTRWLEKSA